MEKFKISTGRKRTAKSWSNNSITWDDFCARLSAPIITTETTSEYAHMSKDLRSEIKDVGGFVAGHLSGGRRINGSVLCRSMITLDLDNCPSDIMERVERDMPYKWASYTTHSHTPENPRRRLILPMTREVTPDEYVPIARMVASKVGMDYFDDTTYQPARLMYWPSRCKNGEYRFDQHEGAEVDPDEILGCYDDWHDISTYPVSSRQSMAAERLSAKVADPLEKKGIIGAFNRVYRISDVIAKFLPEIYSETSKEGRYTYVAGTSYGGAVVYNDDTLLYSNHGTDPAAGYAVNAFDLVRIHKFYSSSFDEKGSVAEMNAFALSIPEVSYQLQMMRMEEISTDLTQLDLTDEDSDKWRMNLRTNKSGEIMQTAVNLDMIFANDKNLQFFAQDDLAGQRAIIGEAPFTRNKDMKTWTDEDTAHTLSYLSRVYATEFPEKKVDDAIVRAAGKRRFNPMRDYFDSLVWDGVPRLDTALIDHLGAADTTLMRTVTRKWHCAAIARAYHPGTQFDSLLVLEGGQGIGKTSYFRKMGGDFFTESITLNSMASGKDALEKMQGMLIAELGELSGMRKVEQNSIKQFLTVTKDRFRGAYARNTVTIPRTCIFCATTNDSDGFLRDLTGNRRYWVVHVDAANVPEEIRPYNMEQPEIDQIWAEAKMRYEQGEVLKLPPDLEQEMINIQKSYLDTDGREELIIQYLDMPLPDGWYDWSVPDRRSHVNSYMNGVKTGIEGTIERQRVSHLEVFTELYGNDGVKITKQDNREIRGALTKLGWTDLGNQRVKGYGAKSTVWQRSQK